VNELKLELKKEKLKWTETCFSSCYFSCNSFQARLTEKNFRPALAFTPFYVEVQMLCAPPSVLQKCKFLASSIVQVSVLSLDVMLSVSSQLDTYIAEVQAGGTLSVNAFEFWHARGPSWLAWLVKAICAPALQAYVEHICSLCGLLYSGRWSAMFRSLQMRVCLKLSQRVLKNLLSKVTVFQRLAAANLGLM